MIRYEDTVGLDCIPNKIKLIAIESAIAEKIKLYGVSVRVHAKLIPLYSGQIQKIKSAHDKNGIAVRIIDDHNNLNNLYPPPDHEKLMLSNGTAIKVSINDLRISKSDLDNPELALATKQISVRAKNADLRIAAAFLEFISGTTPGIKPHPDFANQSQFIEFIAKIYEGFDGLSESNLSRKVSEAKKLLSN